MSSEIDDQSTNRTSQAPQEQGPAQHVAEAHRLLNDLRKQSIKHPDLDAAIGRLEMALSLLTTNTGGML